MKIIGIGLVLILIIQISFGQESKKDEKLISFGLKGGLNLQNFNGKDFWGDRLDEKSILCYHMGVIANIHLASLFYLQPGLLFTVKGSKREITELPSKGEGSIVKTFIRLSYLELPLTIISRPKVGKSHLLMGFGPYIGYGILGRVKTSGDNFTSTVDVRFKNEVRLEDLSNYAYYRALDAGANIISGYELNNGMFFQLSVQIGVCKVNPSYELLSNNKALYKNTGFGFSAGYCF